MQEPDIELLVEARQVVRTCVIIARDATARRHPDWPTSDGLVATLGSITDEFMVVDRRLEDAGARLPPSGPAIDAATSRDAASRSEATFSLLHTKLFELQKLLRYRNDIANRDVYLFLTERISRLEKFVEAREVELRF